MDAEASRKPFADIIEINDFEKINVGDIKHYQRGTQKLEVRKIAIE